jgi:hypothetical protein
MQSVFVLASWYFNLQMSKRKHNCKYSILNVSFLFVYEMKFMCIETVQLWVTTMIIVQKYIASRIILITMLVVIPAKRKGTYQSRNSYNGYNSQS